MKKCSILGSTHPSPLQPEGVEMSSYLRALHVPHKRLGTPSANVFESCHALFGAGTDHTRMQKSVETRLFSDCETADVRSTYEASIREVANYVEECRIVVVDDEERTFRGHGATWRRARRRGIIVRQTTGEFCAIRCATGLHDRLIHHACRGDAPVRLSRACMVLYTLVFLVSFAAAFSAFTLYGYRVVSRG